MTPTLERDLRDALHRRAAEFRPRPREVPTATPAADVGRRILLPVAAIVLPVALLVAAVLALRSDDDVQVPAGETGDVPQLIVELPGATYAGVERGSTPLADGPFPNRLQSFREPARFDGPMVFVTTVTDLSSFGLVQPGEGVETVQVRGRDANLARYNGSAGSSRLSVDLGDGTALSVIATGMDDTDLVAFLDGLQPRDDGLWDPPAADLVEVLDEPAPDGAYWQFQVSSPIAEVDVSLRPGGLESMLGDRVGSTAGPVEQAEMLGVPAAIGSYSANDWWVLFEPSSGRTVELRITGDRTAVDAVLAGVRVATTSEWDRLFPS